MHKSRLRDLFPGADNDTKVVLLGRSTNIIEGRNKIELAPYEISDGEHVHAGYSHNSNIIYFRLIPIYEEKKSNG
jgi:hypothetical protein